MEETPGEREALDNEARTYPRPGKLAAPTEPAEQHAQKSAARQESTQQAKQPAVHIESTPQEKQTSAARNETPDGIWEDTTSKTA